MSLISTPLRIVLPACLLLALPVIAFANNPNADFNVVARSVVLHRDHTTQVQRYTFYDRGTARSTPQVLKFDLPQFTNDGNTLDLDVPTLEYRPYHDDYVARGRAVARVDGSVVKLDTLINVRIKTGTGGADLRGIVFGREEGEEVVRTVFRANEVNRNPDPDGKGPAPDDHDVFMPVKPLSWSDVPNQYRPPQRNHIDEVISADHPKLAEKLSNPYRKGWLVVVSDDAFPLGAFEFAGWVKIECPTMNLTWQYNSIRGLTGDDRLWLEGVEVTGPGDSTIFQGVDYLYTDRCLFRKFGHVIMDTGTWNGFDGAVINTEFRENYHDPFQYFAGAVMNVSVTSMAYETGAHADFFQTTYARGLYWKHVWCGTPKKPVALMGLRGLSIHDSYFEDVRHYRDPSTGHFSVDIVDASGTVFKDCVFTGPVRQKGAKFK